MHACIVALDGFEGWNHEYQQDPEEEARQVSPSVDAYGGFICA
jgi:hypothetical protein